MRYLVTIKLPRNRDHDPRNKKSGPCPVSGYCTDVTGEHHSYLTVAPSEADAREEARARGFSHVTRIELV